MSDANYDVKRILAHDAKGHDAKGKAKGDAKKMLRQDAKV